MAQAQGKTQSRGGKPNAKAAGGSDPHVTPAMRQFHHFKKQHPGCVLFFRMGDFYEMFYEDAELAHRVLGVTLTQRTKGIPMAGVPYHAVEGYLRRMIQAGHRVAVCDQVQDPAEAKASGGGVVERDVTRVITPGTLTDESLLHDGQQNPLAAAVFLGDDAVALAWCELSTGALHVARLSANEAREELARIAPSELLYVETATGEAPPRVEALKAGLAAVPSGRPAWQFRLAEAGQVLAKQYGVRTLAGFGFDEDDPALAAAGGLVHYLLETQRTTGGGRLAHLRPPRRFERSAHMVIDPTSLRSLEVEATMRSGQADGSLLSVLGSGAGRCVTAMGKRLMRTWLCYPLCDRAAIEARQRVVRAIVDDTRFLDELRDALGGVQDVERIAARLAVGRATPRDLVGLGRSAAQVAALERVLADRPSLGATHQRIAALQQALTRLGGTLASACVDEPPAHLRNGGLIRDGHDAQLDEARELQRDSHSWLARYQKQLIDSTGLPTLKVGFNKVFGYYIEVTAANKDKAPDAWTRKQTLKNAERFITPELKEFEGKVLSAESRAVAREQKLFEELCAAACGQMEALHAFAEAVAELDVLAGFAGRAARHGYVQPTIVDEPVLRIDAGRHPVLDALLGDRFVPNDVALGSTDQGPGTRGETESIGADTDSPPSPGRRSEASLALITGPNMAGKSTYIRQAALITLLAHTGSFVPADRAVVGVTDRIFTRIGASDELHTGQSTFMVEMTETANLCHHATPGSLIILDEIGRGTSTLDGLSLAWAIAEHIAGTGARCLFATHYHELTGLADRLPGVTNLNVSVREWNDEIVFLHRIVPGATDRSYGIHVAKIAGLPPAVVARANALLGELAVSHESVQPQAPAPAAAPPPAQLPLFTEYMQHPALDRIRETDLNALSPLEAFDLLRAIQRQLTGVPQADGDAETPRSNAPKGKLR